MAELSMARIIENFEILHAEVKLLRQIVKCLAFAASPGTREAAVGMVKAAAAEKPKFAAGITAEYLSEIGITQMAADYIAVLQRRT